MKEGSIDAIQPFIANHQPAKVPQPGKGAFNDPAMLVSSEFASILMGRLFVVRPCRNDRLNAPLDQLASKRVAVIASICNQSLGLPAWHTHRV